MLANALPFCMMWILTVKPIEMLVLPYILLR